MITSPETAEHLSHVIWKFDQDFPTLGHAYVAEVVDGLAAELLRAAHFDQFVPLLVERAARDRLAEEAGKQARSAEAPRVVVGAPAGA